MSNMFNLPLYLNESDSDQKNGFHRQGDVLDSACPNPKSTTESDNMLVSDIEDCWGSFRPRPVQKDAVKRVGNAAGGACVCRGTYWLWKNSNNR